MEVSRTITQYDIYWVSLDPTEGSEIAKTRPCVIVSPDELNAHLRTVIIAPLTSTIKNYPYRVNCVVSRKKGSIALDQLRTVDKVRLSEYIAHLSANEIEGVKDVLREMLC